jgi:hypothetical protein
MDDPLPVPTPGLAGGGGAWALRARPLGLGSAGSGTAAAPPTSAAAAAAAAAPLGSGGSSAGADVARPSARGSSSGKFTCAARQFIGWRSHPRRTKWQITLLPPMQDGMRHEPEQQLDRHYSLAPRQLYLVKLCPKWVGLDRPFKLEHH